MTVQPARAIEDDEVGRGTLRRGRAQPAEPEPRQDPRGATRQRRDRPGERQPPGVDRREEQAERRLDPGDPVGRQAELDLLVDPGVGGMVGGDRVGRPVEEGGQDRGCVAGGAQRRVDPEGRVVRAGDEGAVGPRVARRASVVDGLPGPASGAGEPLVGEREVMRRDVAGDREPGRLRPSDELERRRGREVGQVEPRPRLVGEDVGEDRQVPADRTRLGGAPASP